MSQCKRKINPKYCSRECYLKAPKDRKGVKHNRWNGGRKTTTRGYIRIYTANHPFADKRNYVLEHRLIMEKHIGRPIKLPEVVHHEGKKSDNRIQMLILFKNNGYHTAFHRWGYENGIIFDGRHFHSSI